MRWLLKKALGGVLLFPSNVFVALFFAWLIKRHYPGLSKLLVAATLMGAYVFSCASFSGQLIRGLERSILPLNLNDPEVAKRADAIVILGAGRTFSAREYGRDVVSENGFLRLRYGVAVQHATRKPILVTGGAPDRPGKSEADLMAEALEESFGTRAQWLERESVDTAENARLSFIKLAPAGVRRIYLVTHAVYMRRAQAAFKKAGFEVVPAPMGYLTARAGGGLLDWIPSAIGVEMSSIFFHEAIGVGWYRLVGEI